MTWVLTFIPFIMIGIIIIIFILNLSIGSAIDKRQPEQLNIE